MHYSCRSSILNEHFANKGDRSEKEERMAQLFTCLVWLLFFCMFCVSHAAGDETLKTLAFSGVVLVTSFWIGWWFSGGKRKGE